MKVSVVLLRSKVFTLMVRSVDLQKCEESYVLVYVTYVLVYITYVLVYITYVLVYITYVLVYITGPILIRDKD